MGDLSRNFSRWEFVCGHCAAQKSPPPAFVAALQRLRDEVGRPLEIISGYRCAYWNRAVGGKWFSQHRRANAADIPAGYATPDQCRRAGFHGVGIRSGQVVHVDLTPGRGFFTFAD